MFFLKKNSLSNHLVEFFGPKPFWQSTQAIGGAGVGIEVKPHHF